MLYPTVRDRGSTVVKVLCYTSEGCWFDLRGAVGAGAICVLPDEPSLQFDTARANGLHEEIKMEVVSVVK